MSKWSSAPAFHFSDAPRINHSTEGGFSRLVVGVASRSHANLHERLKERRLLFMPCSRATLNQRLEGEHEPLDSTQRHLYYMGGAAALVASEKQMRGNS